MELKISGAVHANAAELEAGPKKKEVGPGPAHNTGKTLSGTVDR